MDYELVYDSPRPMSTEESEVQTPAAMPLCCSGLGSGLVFDCMERQGDWKGDWIGGGISVGHRRWGPIDSTIVFVRWVLERSTGFSD